MTSKKDFHFYSGLDEYQQSITELFQNEPFFSDVPSNWYVIVTDIKDSTKMISSGKDEIINFVATGSIIAILNIAHAHKTTIPFFFGGDGATMIIPPQILEESLNALKEHQQNSVENFDVFIRVGSMPVSEVYESGHHLKIAKAKMNEYLSIPIILGAGLQFAESIIKANESIYQRIEILEKRLNLDGMECRWDKVDPPEENHEILCLLVNSLDSNKQAYVYKKVLDKIEIIYGSHKKRSPISISGLKLNATVERINSEMRIRYGSGNINFLLKRLLATFVGKFYLRFNKEGKQYLNSLIQLTDTLVLDGRINTVISGLNKQHNELEKYLTDLEEAGELWFGIYRSKKSIMSCYVRDRKDQHIHFVDGVDGGYTKAAAMLKNKI